MMEVHGKNFSTNGPLDNRSTQSMTFTTLPPSNGKSWGHSTKTSALVTPYTCKWPPRTSWSLFSSVWISAWPFLGLTKKCLAEKMLRPAKWVKVNSSANLFSFRLRKESKTIWLHSQSPRRKLLTRKLRWVTNTRWSNGTVLTSRSKTLACKIWLIT